MDGVSVERLMAEARQIAKGHGHSKVEVEHLLRAFASLCPELAERLLDASQLEELDRRLAEKERGFGTPEPDERCTQLLEELPRGQRRSGIELFGALAQEVGLDAAQSVTSVVSEDPPKASQPNAATGRVATADVQLDMDAVAEAVRRAIVGQDRAIDRICRRVSLTARNLDLRPERPDGIFLLAGPTGVGKTALVSAFASALRGSDDALIRLDMSEYRGEWAVSRLVGPQPGFVGYDQPEGWLTTKLLKRPDAIVLLDEVEKAHPAVWLTLLQAFDAGRLTDARGRTVDCSRTIFFMTSNLGSEAFKTERLGFGAASPSSDRASIERQVRRQIERVMPPELVNRLDDIIVFEPLTDSAIMEIAQREIGQVVQRLGEAGYQMIVDAGAVEAIARDGYDPRYGARHLHRAIEANLLEALVSCSPGSYRMTLADSRPRLVPQ